MPKGKKGPIPEMQVTAESGVTIIEESFLPEEPTVEEIVGKENVVDVGAAAPPSESLPEPAGYKCADCTFTSNLLSEIEEHCRGTQHGGYGKQEPVEAVQPELFSESGIVHRMVNVMLPAELLNDKRVRLAALYQSALEVKDEKKSADDDFNARLKNIDSQMQEIARVLRTPFTYEKVDCEWRIIQDENARGLYRLDTGEQIEKQPLTEEDRVREIEQAAQANNPEQTQEATA